MKKLDICCELWVNFKITLARCHHERGDSRATDLTMVHAVEAVDGMPVLHAAQGFLAPAQATYTFRKVPPERLARSLRMTMTSVNP